MSSDPVDGDVPTAPESVVRRYYRLVDEQAYEALCELFTENIVYERPGQEPIEGKAAFRAFYESGRPLENGSHEVHDVVVSGGGGDGDGRDDPTVAVRGTFTGDQDGERVRFGFADFHEFADGRIARRYTFTDRDEV